MATSCAGAPPVGHCVLEIDSFVRASTAMGYMLAFVLSSVLALIEM